MASMETDADATGAATPGPGTMAGLAGLGAVALGVVGLLWWRFGEGVYATSIMNAILACF
jgi:hypothetical protein